MSGKVPVSCLRDWRLLVCQLSVLPKLIEHHSSIVPRGLKGAVNLARIMPISVSLLERRCNFIPVWTKKIAHSLYFIINKYYVMNYSINSFTGGSEANLLVQGILFCISETILKTFENISETFLRYGAWNAVLSSVERVVQARAHCRDDPDLKK